MPIEHGDQQRIQRMMDWCDGVTASWPDWLRFVVRHPYHARDRGGAGSEQAADEWWSQVRVAASPPVDYDVSRHRFLIAVLEEVKHLSPAVVPVVALHRTELAGEAPTQEEWDDARAGGWYAQDTGWSVASIVEKAVGIAASAANRQTARAAARAQRNAGDTSTSIACRAARIDAVRQMRAAQRKHLLDALWSSRRQPGNPSY